jgi:Domain of unknown function (DUF305)
MMNIMHTTGSAAGFPALWGIHILSVALFFVGVILLILWAAKTLSQSRLKMWGIVLAVVGTVACLLTIGARGTLWGGMSMSGTSEMKMEHMQKMDMGDDAMSMSMNDMSAILKGKTGDAFDKAFVEGMIPHHQGAIDMAREALKNAKHDEIKRMARDIISAQQREIDQMNQWLKDWGYAN